MKYILTSLALAILLTGCANQPEPSPAQHSGQARLAPCPASPNCASTQAASSAQLIKAPTLAVAPEQAWPAVVAAVKTLPRTRLTEQDGYYLRAESRSWLFRFTDDIELYLDHDKQQLTMRSASRLGYSDLGVNSRRLTKLIDKLRLQGIVK
ncbi:DUF1499 domain-containing protein [Oceanicoccus sagamiensis]|uniref:DUF1499 domain-containing protein n=1 Tax=Oceanicoccus sagamiensis TaxID=716816 RepID=UPI00146A067D|nr:DUF1499 domain-containing protein [Oceanicoccus sagamiensis]